jgi:hypothetical protein
MTGNSSSARTAGAPYLAFFWRDVGSRPQPKLSRQHPLTPTSGQKKARYGAPAFVAMMGSSLPHPR